VTWNGEQGVVHVRGEEWRARSGKPLTPGQTVRVAARQDLTLIVEPETQALPKPQG
jgi:membrane-bound serine protease (ClpP class)